MEITELSFKMAGSETGGHGSTALKNSSSNNATKTNTKWFLNQLEMRNLTQRKLAALLKTSTSAVSLFLRGKRKLQLKEATAMAALFGVPLDEVLQQSGFSTAGVETGKPLLIKGWVDGAFNVHFGPPRGPKTAPRPQVGGKGLTCLRIQSGASGPAAGLDGGLVYYPAFDGVANDVVGRLCVVKMASTGNWALRVLRRSYQAGSYELASLNGTTMEENEILEVATPVVWMRLG